MSTIVEDFADAFEDFGAKHGQISKQTLCKILHHLDSSWTKKRLEHLLDGFGCSQDINVDTYKFFDWIIHPQPSLVELPLKCRSERQRSQFLREQWEPFQEEVENLLQSTAARADAGFSLHEIMPSHLRLRALTDKCRSLTETWHGRANISYMYEMFMKMAERDGHSGYLFEDIPQQRSEDGFVRVLDGEARARLYTGSKSASRRKCLALVGRMQQTTGESPIDNLQLPNLMRRKDALLLTVGRRIQQFFVWALRWKQRRIMARFPSECHQAAVKARAQSMQEGDDSSVALNILVEHGCLVESYGQVPQVIRTRADEFIAECLQRPEGELDEELADFLKHCQINPGRPYKADRVGHKLLLLKALRSPELRVMWRSDVEAFTQHRYITGTWTRRAPLYYLPDDGSECVVLRRPGDEESSRFRKNIFAYAESHGLGQSGGGWTDSSHWPAGSLMYELGSLLCIDEAAKLPNHFVTDIEKIVQDCVLLCPDGVADALPGEVLHDAGQNPIVASSIGKSQHTQVSKASVEDFPLMKQQQSPRWCSKLDAFVDIVQVGKDKDAFFVCVRTRTPNSKPVLDFLVQLRLEYLRSFGRAVDFNCTCHASVTGEYYVNLAPVACMRKIKVPVGEGCLGLDFDYLNPELRDSNATWPSCGYSGLITGKRKSACKFSRMLERLLGRAICSDSIVRLQSKTWIFAYRATHDCEAVSIALKAVALLFLSGL